MSKPTPSRRSFLLGTVAAGAAATLPTEARAHDIAPAPKQDRAY